jgi:hypothetical protein
MDICGHCGGMDRHLGDCRFGEVVRADPEIHLSRAVSPHDPQHAAPNTTGSRVLIPLYLVLIMVSALGLAFVLKWP